MNILITAFEPFAGNELNPSYEVLKLLPDNFCDIKIKKILCEVSFKDAFKPIKEELDKNSYDVVIMLGQYGGINNIRLEMASHNIISSSKPDNDGVIPEQQPIIDGADYGYFTCIDVWSLHRKLAANGIKVDISESAGTYVCNFIYFSCLNYIRIHNRNIKAMFVHLPYITEQNRLPCMTLDEETNTILSILKEIEV